MVALIVVLVMPPNRFESLSNPSTLSLSVVTTVGAVGVVISIICIPLSLTAVTRAYVLESITTVLTSYPPLSVEYVLPLPSAELSRIDTPEVGAAGRLDISIICTPSLLVVTMAYVLPPITIGLMYRGIPIKKHESTPPAGASQVNETINPSTDALVFLLGMQISAFQFAYSYDFTISTLSSESGGAHEISLIWEFELVNPKRVKRKIKSIPCPTFNSGGGLNPFRKN